MVWMYQQCMVVSFTTQHAWCDNDVVVLYEHGWTMQAVDVVVSIMSIC